LGRHIFKDGLISNLHGYNFAHTAEICKKLMINCWSTC